MTLGTTAQHVPAYNNGSAIFPSPLDRRWCCFSGPLTNCLNVLRLTPRDPPCATQGYRYHRESVGNGQAQAATGNGGYGKVPELRGKIRMVRDEGRAYLLISASLYSAGRMVPLLSVVPVE